MSKQYLKFMTCGSVDDGKSTLIGRLLYDNNSIFTDQLDDLESVSKHYGTREQEIDFALLVDGLQSEREQGITIDIAYRYFHTCKRNFILCDTPGHEQYTRNMATAASQVDLAVLLVDASKGILTQTKRHTYITTLFGVKHIIIAVNKMDSIDYDEKIFESIKHSFLTMLSQFADEKLNISFIPISAIDGDNIVNKSQHMSWFSGETLLNCLETVEISTLQNNILRYPVQYVNRPNADFRGYAGTLASGQICVGDYVKILPSHKKTYIKEIVTYDGSLTTATKGEAITLTLKDNLDVTRGDIIVTHDDTSKLTDTIEVMLLWMDDSPLLLNHNYQLELASISLKAKISHISYLKDIETLKEHQKDFLVLNDIAKCTISIESPILADRYKDNKTMGSFILIDNMTSNTSAAGIIVDNTSNEHLFVQKHTITKELRTELLQQKPFILWFTGLSASGKSTLANEIEKELYSQGCNTYLLDGDNLRNTLNDDLGFSIEDRAENIRRIAHISQTMLDAGLIVITAFISPFAKERDFARSLVSDDEFIEVFIDTPIEICEERDSKGLYEKARKNIIKDFTGINSPYEKPANPEITIVNQNVTKSVVEIVDYLKKNNFY